MFEALRERLNTLGPRAFAPVLITRYRGGPSAEEDDISAKTAYETMRFPGIEIVILGLVAAGWCYFHFRSDDPLANLTSDANMASDIFACRDVADSHDAIHLMKDGEAFLKFYVPREDAQLCRQINKDTRIAVERRIADGHTGFRPELGHWYCVRSYGEPDCYWALGQFVFGKGV